MITSTFHDAYRRYLASFSVPDLQDIAAVGVKFVHKGEQPPPQAAPLDMAYTWCYAVRQASKGEVPLVNRDSVGCVMAAIALGLVDEDDPEPLPGWRQYSRNMAAAPAPADYKAGRVFACAAADQRRFALYGADDPGRFKSVAAAQRAFADMPKIQPACMDAVVAFPPSAELTAITPDVVILVATPRAAMRTIQGLVFSTGQRFTASTLGVAGFCVDLVTVPYVTGAANASFLCVGARAIARWEGGLCGLGLPWQTFLAAVDEMEATVSGYPFQKYPA
jgi:uncharacterized protein (DUF169 family)